MSQHDYIISNQSFPATRADINNVLNSIATLNSGTSAPATQYAGQLWVNTTTATAWVLYIYDGADNIQLATINTSTNTVNFTDSALDVLTDTTPQLGGNLDVNGNSIVSTSNANITLAPDGTGDVVLSADTVKIGDANANATITTDGTGDLILNTNSGTNSGSITIADGVNGAITVAPNGTGIFTVTGNLSVDGGTIKLDGNYPVGTSNIALGDGALDDGSLTGCFNTAVGNSALTSNTTGSCNTAIGYNTLLCNTTATRNVAIGALSLDANTTGECNVAVGNGSLGGNTTGCDNTAVGFASLLALTTGCLNTAVGDRALQNATTPSENTAVGYGSSNQNSTGACNTAIGTCSLYNTTTGGCNSAVGKNALLCNSTGCLNTAIGAFALDANTTASQNTAVGYDALGANTTGCQNTAVGALALDSNTTGLFNNAFGYGALADNTTGCDNNAFGLCALIFNTTGTNNTAYGHVAGADAVACITSGSNNIVMGNNGHTCARIKIAWTVTSDARDKTCIDVVPHGLCFVKQLNPISFFYKKSRDKNYPTGRKRYGFKAQDILPLENGDAVIISDDEPENLKYNESSLIPVLVNAIKELTAKVEDLQNRINQLES